MRPLRWTWWVLYSFVAVGALSHEGRERVPGGRFLVSWVVWPEVLLGGAATYCVATVAALLSCRG